MADCLYNKNTSEHIYQCVYEVVYDIKSSKYYKYLIKISKSAIGSDLVNEHLHTLTLNKINNIKCYDINYLIEKLKHFDEHKFAILYDLIFDFNYTDKCLSRTYDYSKIMTLINMKIISLGDKIYIKNEKITIHEYLLKFYDFVFFDYDKYFTTYVDYIPQSSHYNFVCKWISSQSKYKQDNIKKINAVLELPKCLQTIVIEYIYL